MRRVLVGDESIDLLTTLMNSKPPSFSMNRIIMFSLKILRESLFSIGVRGARSGACLPSLFHWRSDARAEGMGSSGSWRMLPPDVYVEVYPLLLVMSEGFGTSDIVAVPIVGAIII